MPYPPPAPPHGYLAQPPPAPVAPSGQPLAEFWQRLVAYLIDGLIVSAVLMILILPLYIGWIVWFMSRVEQLEAREPVPAGEPDPVAAELGTAMLLFFGLFAAMIVLTLVASYVYFVEMMFRTGQTLGKKVMKIRVVPLDPVARLTRGDAARRWLVQWAGGTFIPLFSYLDGLWQLWDRPYRQCLHDKFPQTTVVRYGA